MLIFDADIHAQLISIRQRTPICLLHRLLKTLMTDTNTKYTEPQPFTKRGVDLMVIGIDSWI